VISIGSSAQGLPVLFLYLLASHRKRLRDPEVRVTLGFLYEGESVPLAHKLLLVKGTSFSSSLELCYW